MEQSTLVEQLGSRASELTPEAADILAHAVDSPRLNAHLLPVEEARRNFDADFAEVGPGEDVAAVREHRLAVDDGEIAVREFRPAAGTLPAVVYFHGGGWLLGSLDSHTVVCRALANASGAAVCSVDYRRGPESRFPTAVEDSFAALRWLKQEADRLGVDPERIAVAGDSAGQRTSVAPSRRPERIGRLDVFRCRPGHRPT